jgi:hypothetical protein
MRNGGYGGAVVEGGRAGSDASARPRGGRLGMIDLRAEITARTHTARRCAAPGEREGGLGVPPQVRGGRQATTPSPRVTPRAETSSSKACAFRICRA